MSKKLAKKVKALEARVRHLEAYVHKQVAFGALQANNLQETRARQILEEEDSDTEAAQTLGEERDLFPDEEEELKLRARIANLQARIESKELERLVLISPGYYDQEDLGGLRLPRYSFGIPKDETGWRILRDLLTAGIQIKVQDESEFIKHL